ncbi:hypothetical protein [Streptomyces albidoflavus]
MEHPSMQVAAEEFGVRVASYGQFLEVRDDPSGFVHFRRQRLFSSLGGSS